MEEKKTKQIHLRLTEKEYNFLKDAAQEWGGSVSSYILESSKRFKGVDKVNKLQFIREWNVELRKHQADIDKIGTNINQIAHVINVMKLQGEVAFSEDMVKEIQACRTLLRTLERYEERAVRGLLK